MTDTDKIKIRPLDDKSDFALWRIRVQAAISAKGLSSALEKPTAEGTPVLDADKEKNQQASNIIVSALGDHALRVVRTIVGRPYEMMQKLDARYDSKSTASKISKMVELVSVRYTSVRDDMSKHIDRLAGLVEQLNNMGSQLPEDLTVGILVASIEVTALMPVTASIKTLSDENLKWEDVSSRLIEEVKSLSKGSSSDDRAASAQVSCDICKKPHATSNCYLNPMNPNNKLNLKTDQVSEILNSNVSRQGTGKERKRSGRNKKSGRAAMAKSRKRQAEPRPVDQIMLDSGTTSHMTKLIDRVHSRHKSDVEVRLADDSVVEASEVGVRTVRWMTDDGQDAVHLSETLVIPTLASSLLSVPALVNKNISVLFLPGQALLVDLEDDYRILGRASQSDDGLFYIPDHQVSDSPKQSANSTLEKSMMAIVRRESKPHAKKNDSSLPTVEIKPDERRSSDQVDLWHNRLGHVTSVENVRKLVKEGELPHVECSMPDCRSCAKGKYRNRFSGSLSNARKVGRLHVDTKGKVEEKSEGGHKYFLTIVEEYSRYTAVFPLRTKGEASDQLLQFIKWFEKQSGYVVTAVHTDGGSEFKRALFFLTAEGVDVSISTAYTPNSNGLVERSHGIILSNVRSCMEQAKLPAKYWHWAIRHVTACRNFIPHHRTGAVPYSTVFGRTYPDLHHLRVFGCRVLYRPPVKKLTTFGSRLREGILLLHEGGGVYRVLTDTGTVRTKHVKPLETEFPGMGRIERSKLDDDEGSISNFSLSSDESSDHTSDEDIPDAQERSIANWEVQVDMEELTHVPVVESSHGVTPPDSDRDEQDDDEESQAENSANDADGSENDHPSGYNLRPRRPVSYTHMALPKTITTDDEPKLRVALNSAERSYWLKAIEEEFDTLTKNGTWVVRSRPPPDMRPLPSGVILKLKRDSLGRPARFKGRLVARGNFQSKDVDYLEIYAPVACIELVRTIITIAIAMGWDIEQVDVKGAFLHATLPKDERVFILLPKIKGISSANGQLVELIKSLYGLRQAPKLWYQHFAKAIARFGYKRSNTNECLFVGPESVRAFIIVYVDDLLLVGPKKIVAELKTKLKELFEITDLGRCSYFLGIKVDYLPRGIFLSQKSYAESILLASNMDSAKFARSPLPMSHPLYEAKRSLTTVEKQFMENVPYRSLLGKLLFLGTRTRPDIATAVSMLAKFQSAPAPEHWTALKHVLKYIAGTKSYGLLIPYSSGKILLEAWSDADWARDLDRRRSRTGFVIMLNDVPIIWTSKLQTATASSTPEAEFAALAASVRDVCWAREILNECGFPVSDTTTIYQDNLGAISWTTGVQGMRRVKHVGINFNVVRDMVDGNHISVQYEPSERNRADSLTKALIGDEFEKHRQYLGVRCIDQ